MAMEGARFGLRWGSVVELGLLTVVEDRTTEKGSPSACREEATGWDDKSSAAKPCNCLQSIKEKLSMVQVEAILELLYSDGGGVLGYDYFFKPVYMEEKDVMEMTLEAFISLQDGRKELHSGVAIAWSGEERVRMHGMLKRYDLNGEGVICFKEFKLIMLFTKSGSSPDLWDLAEEARERKKDRYLCNEQAFVIFVPSDPTEERRGGVTSDPTGRNVVEGGEKRKNGACAEDHAYTIIDGFFGGFMKFFSSKSWFFSIIRRVMKEVVVLCHHQEGEKGGRGSLSSLEGEKGGQASLPHRVALLLDNFVDLPLLGKMNNFQCMFAHTYYFNLVWLAVGEVSFIP
ncbi:hypothetical protein IEQ34_017497 [Dendrobium chrysotoxum]|uniref:EF-hand domain-containing protein n=1 Tax=Dendrobium chrysotoxum TaxID=161865 RepID=A0AAV7GBM4_DENCH|nr:hypothetical protein IEQ34_017497 [Dendrobium chrysotoxum]